MLFIPINTTKNITIKSLSHLERKLVKVTNQHMMTCSYIQTNRTSFSVTLLIVFSHQYGEKMLRKKVQDPKHEKVPKIETNPR